MNQLLNLFITTTHGLQGQKEREEPTHTQPMKKRHIRNFSPITPIRPKRNLPPRLSKPRLIFPSIPIAIGGRQKPMVEERSILTQQRFQIQPHTAIMLPFPLFEHIHQTQRHKERHRVHRPQIPRKRLLLNKHTPFHLPTSCPYYGKFSPVRTAKKHQIPKKIPTPIQASIRSEEKRRFLT